jgi:hypothetical protein
MTLDYPKTSAALGPFTLDRIEVDQSNHWTLKVNWPVGEISFSSSGFLQRLTGEPVISSSQALDPPRRTNTWRLGTLPHFTLIEADLW